MENEICLPELVRAESRPNTFTQQKLAQSDDPGQSSRYFIDESSKNQGHQRKTRKQIPSWKAPSFRYDISRPPSAQPSVPLQDRRLVPGCRRMSRDVAGRRTARPCCDCRWVLHLGSRMGTRVPCVQNGRIWRHQLRSLAA